MININLLPEALRKKERMPLPHFLGIVLGIGLFCFLIYTITKYQFDIIPGLEAQKANLQRDKRNLLAQVEELKSINSQITKLSEYVDAVKTLYRNRVVWSKILADIKSIVNFDPTMSEYNGDMRYLWYTRFSGTGKEINLSGFATASTPLVAMQMPERLLVGFLTYSATSVPEKDEEARLQNELRQVVMEYDSMRRENPDLPVRGPKETKVRQRLEEIKNIKSGGIALQPFSSFLVPGSLRLINATWQGAPQPKKRPAGSGEIFPKEAWNFSISMTLK